jgi:hypothetical protein
MPNRTKYILLVSVMAPHAGCKSPAMHRLPAFFGAPRPQRWGQNPQGLFVDFGAPRPQRTTATGHLSSDTRAARCLWGPPPPHACQARGKGPGCAKTRWAAASPACRIPAAVLWHEAGVSRRGAVHRRFDGGASAWVGPPRGAMSRQTDIQTQTDRHSAWHSLQLVCAGCRGRWAASCTTTARSCRRRGGATTMHCKKTCGPTAPSWNHTWRSGSSSWWARCSLCDGSAAAGFGFVAAAGHSFCVRI